MTETIAITSTKGGVGKTTTAANLGALLADAGKKVLLIDLDIQPTLSSYFELASEAPGGIYELIGLNTTDLNRVVSKTTVANLDLIVSNDPQNNLGVMLLNAPDGRIRLINLLPRIRDHYDVILIDTQGARSVILEMVLLAADLAVSPVMPEMLAARELRRGTLTLFSELQSYQALGLKVPRLKLLINRADPVSTDAQIISQSLRDTFHTEEANVLGTIIPSLTVYRQAATLGVPVHRLEYRKPSGRKAESALTTMQALATELFPQWQSDIAALTPEKVSRLSNYSYEASEEV